MKELLFGWLVKPNYKVTALDGLIGVVEIIVLCFIIAYIYVCISELIEMRNK